MLSMYITFEYVQIQCITREPLLKAEVPSLYGDSACIPTWTEPASGNYLG